MPTDLTATAPLPLNTLLDIPAAQYHALDRLSSSGIKQLLRSPAKYKAWRAGEVGKRSAALSFGTLLHHLVLEPGSFARSYSLGPSMAGIKTKSGTDALNPLATTEGKERLAAWHAANPDVQIIDLADRDKAFRMHDSLEKRGFIEAFAEGRHEVTILWDANVGGVTVPCKARMDCYAPNLDLKTCANIDDDAIVRDAFSYGYHIQAAWYGGASVQVCFNQPLGFVFIETEPPYQCVLKTPDVEVVEHGRLLVAQALTRYAECTQTGTWYGVEYFADPLLRLPPWAKRKGEAAESERRELASGMDADGVRSDIDDVFGGAL